MVDFVTFARPYAKVLFELSVENRQERDWYNLLFKLAWLVEQPKVRNFILESNNTTVEQVSALISLLGELEVNKDFAANFIHELVVERQLLALPEICSQYKKLWLDSNNTKEVVIYTAHEIDDDSQKLKIISKLEQYFDTHLQAAFQLDPKLIGGIKVEMGDMVLDLSVQAKLKKLYTTLMN